MRLMKTPPPDLPETNDPWTLLDVPRGASSDEIRRAYLRRIKVYKPDLHPTAFRRLREAYDALYVDDRPPPAAFSGWGDEEVVLPVDSVEDGWGHTSTDPKAERSPKTAPRVRDEDEVATLVAELRAALVADDRDRAVDILLRPQTAVLANDRRVADLVARVACAVVLSQPDRFEELMSAFHDILLDRALEHRQGVLSHMRGAASQWAAWQRATEGNEVLSRFVELWGVLDDAELVHLGHEVAAVAHADPEAFLATLDRVARDAPAMLELYAHAASEWADRFGVPSRTDDDGARDAMLDSLEGLVQRNPALSREQLRRNLAALSVAAFVVWLGTSHPILWGTTAMAATTLLYTLTSNPTRKIYRQAIRPAVAAWLWQGHGLDALAAGLRPRLAAIGGSRRWMQPDDVDGYADMLAEDTALSAFAATARLDRRRD